MGIFRVGFRKRKKYKGWSRISGGYSATYHVSNSGNDGDDGLTPGTAWQTISKVNGETFDSGESILFKRGDAWREELTITVNGILISAYGTGNPPIFNCANILTGWSKTAGQTNVYEVDITPEWTVGANWLNAWENDVYLTRASDLGDCDSTPGSMFPSSSTGTITLYIHTYGSDNPGSNGLIYEASIRRFGIEAYAVTGTMATGVETRKNLGESGSARFGRSSTISNCAFNYGNKHNVLVRDGCYIASCSATENYYAGVSSTMFVANEDTPIGLGVVFVNCSATPGTGKSHTAGFNSHYNVSGSFGTISAINCTVTGEAGGYDFDDCAQVITGGTISLPTSGNANAAITNNNRNTSTTVMDVAITMDRGRVIRDLKTAGGTIVIDGCTIEFTTLANSGMIYSIYDSNLTITDNEFIDPDASAVVYFTGSGASVIASGNTYTDPQTIYNLNIGGQTLVSDNNAFSESLMKFNINGTQYTTVEAYVSATGQDNNSSIG